MLTRQQIEESEDVVYLVTDDLIRRVNAVPESEQLALVQQLSEGMRAIWGVFMVDSEVNNGGFNQFFFNSSRDYLNEAREGLRVLGAAPQLELLDEAARRFESEFERLRPYFEQDTVEAFSESYDENVFGDLDDRYFDLDTYALQEAYIRSHPEEFTRA